MKRIFTAFIIALFLAVSNILFLAMPALAVDYAAGDGSLSVYGVDFNGDGYTDLAVANALENTFSVFMNSGNGSFAAHVDYATGSVPMSVWAGDLNGDDLPDVVTADRNSDGISIFFNKGDGAFDASERVYYAVGDGPYCAIGTDIDGDGDQDIVTAISYENKISVMANNGLGVLSKIADYTVGDGPRHIAAGDLNEDGRMDLVVANRLDSTISVLLNLGTGFDQSVYSVSGVSFSAVAVGDVNGDGWLDIVASDGNGDCFRVFPNLGGGSFGSSVAFVNGLAPHSVACADIDGDGDIDAVLADTNGNSADIHLNDGTGNFTEHYNYAVGTGPFSVFCADFDDDGSLDIATANYGADTVSVLLNGREFTHIHTYEITFNQSGVGSDFAGAVVAIDGTEYNVSMLPVSFLWNSGSTHIFEFNSPLVVDQNVKQYVWANTTGLITAQSGSITVSGSGDVTGNFEAVYLQTLPSISDAIGSINENVSHRGIANSLTSKLQNALKALDRGNTEAFEKILNAFINEVTAQSGKKIDAGYAGTLIQWAQAWIANPHLA